MNPAVRDLFHELADLGRADRLRIFEERAIPAAMRAEVESLLEHDAEPGDAISQRVVMAAEAVLRSRDQPEFCGPYRITRELGRGGMGNVYLGERHDGEVEQQVAIKILRSDADRPALRERFLRERQLLASLNHPAIAKLLDAGHTAAGRPYLVMEYIDGVAIDRHTANLGLRDKLDLFLQVCEAVAHAHRRLVVHRDLKPSNILVDGAGQPKLLDFGIAKILDHPLDQTLTIDRVLTPGYASPEQLLGEIQTTATDIYSLGAVLHKLLRGHSPREQALNDAPALPADTGFILAKALADNPADRYPSVDAFAEDIRAFLEMRPIQARPASNLYRLGKFLWRRRIAVAGALVAGAGVTAGLLIARQQSRVAQTRLDQVRQLTDRVLSFDRVISGQQSAATARQDIIATSKRNLETLAAEAKANPGLALEVAEAYSHLARVQGISVDAAPAGHAEAEESLDKAQRFVSPLLRADPGGPRVLWVSARVAHDRMILEASRRRTTAAVEQARAALRGIEQYLEKGEMTGLQAETISELLYNIAITDKNLYQPEDAIRAARLAYDAAGRSERGNLRAGLAVSLLADLLRLDGDFDGAWKAIGDAKRNLEQAAFPSETSRRSAWFTLYLREGRLLGTPDGLGMGRNHEAAAVLQQAFDLLEESARSEPGDAWNRLFFAAVAGQLGDVTARDPAAALRIQDRALARLREVVNGAEARRAEAEILASSAVMLRRLNRPNEAANRIGEAVRLLRLTGDLPARTVAPDDSAFVVLRAIAEQHAASGRPQDAVAGYEDLAAKIAASKPGPESDLRHAITLSELWRSLASVDPLRRNAVNAARLELWRRWDSRRPGNAFIRRQLMLSAPR